MALYLGNAKRKLRVNNVCYSLRIYSENPITSNIILKTSDGKVLMDDNCRYLTIDKEE